MHRLYARAVCCCTLAVLSANVGVAAADSPAVDHARINDVFGLWESELVTLDLSVQPGDAVTFAVPIDGEMFTLEMQPHSVRSADYQVFHQVASGELIETEPGIINTLRGGVAEFPDAVVAGGWFNGAVVAMVVEADGSTHWVEPVASHIADAPSDLYVVYHEADVMPTGATCASDQAAVHLGSHLTDGYGEAALGGGACGGDLCIAELGLDADVEYFNDWGAGTEARMNLIINTVNVQYERDVDITHIISGVIIRTAEPDPYSSFDPFGLLNQFRTEWLTNQGHIPRDVAHLFTNKNLNGSVIGIAWGIGEICGTGAFCLSESDFNNNFNCATDLTAHELGHLWGAFHCNCPGNTMNAFITCANVFSQQSINSIVNHRNSRTCLDGNVIGIPCDDIRRFQARCTNTGRLQMRLLLTDNSHNGETVTFNVDGTNFVRTINGDRATLSINNQGGTGARVITLVDPAGCVNPITVNCN